MDAIFDSVLGSMRSSGLPGGVVFDPILGSLRMGDTASPTPPTPEPGSDSSESASGSSSASESHGEWTPYADVTITGEYSYGSGRYYLVPTTGAFGVSGSGAVYLRSDDMYCMTYAESVSGFSAFDKMSNEKGTMRYIDTAQYVDWEFHQYAPWATFSAIVENAGDETANGDYPLTSGTHGTTSAVYERAGWTLQYEEMEYGWTLRYNGGAIQYMCYGETLTSYWETYNGTEPAPTVTLHVEQ